jgi:hypothetical protein
VVTPQDVAHLDAKRVLELFRGCGIRILGAVENMSDLICPHCGSQIDLFPPVQNERSIWEERRARWRSACESGLRWTGSGASRPVSSRTLVAGKRAKGRDGAIRGNPWGRVLAGVLSASLNLKQPGFVMRPRQLLRLRLP